MAARDFGGNVSGTISELTNKILTDVEATMQGFNQRISIGSTKVGMGLGAVGKFFPSRVEGVRRCNGLALFRELE